MPGNTWRDLKRNSSSTSMSTSEQPRTLDNESSANAGISPKLAILQQQRQQLEQQMHNLTSGAGEAIDPRDAARYHVPTFAQRQAQQREWENRRERLQAQATELRHQARNTPPERNHNRPNQQPTTTHSVNQWLARRDSQRQELRDAARDRLSPLNELSRTGRQLNNSLSQSSGRLQNLDQQLAEHGLDKEREELRDLGTDKLSQASSQINKYTEKADAPMRAINNLDRSWESRQQRINGAMDQTGSYVDRSRNRLSTETGGSGDLFERMDRNRRRALEQRKNKQRAEARDEARRNRAKRNKQKEY